MGVGGDEREVRAAHEGDREARAIESHREQILHDRDDANTRLALAKSMEKAGDYQGVIDAAWDLPFITPYGDESHALLGRAYLELEDWQNARRELELRLALETPAMEEIYPDLAWVLLSFRPLLSSWHTSIM